MSQRRPRRGGSGVAAAWLCALGGCAAVPAADPLPAVEVPAAWSVEPGPGGAAAAGPWWSRFGDPLLSQLVAAALHANTSVVSAQAALQGSRAQSEVAAAALWPTLGSSASVQHGTAGRHSTGNVWQVGLDAGWELDLFGANRSGRDAAGAAALASAYSLADVQVSVAAEVALDYIALRSAQARLLIAADNLASQAQTLQITQWRQQAGLITVLEVEQARAAAAQTRALLPPLRTAIEQGSHALAVLTARPPAALIGQLATPTAVPQVGAAIGLGIPAETLRRRADLRAAEAQVSAAQSRVAQAAAARAPDFRLGGTLGASALTFGGLGSGAAVLSTLLAGVSLPLVDGGALRAQVRVQQAALAQARAAYVATVLLALQDVEDALAAQRGDGERATSLQTAATAARHAALLARQRYSSGLVDFQTVLDTQRTQLATQDSLASAQADLASDQVRLFKALGGGWQGDDTTHPDPARIPLASRP